MVTKAIDDGLRPYSIGEKLRSLRLRKSMGLVELGRHTGLSAALLSKLERGKLYPTRLRCFASPWCLVSDSITFLLTSANVSSSHCQKEGARSIPRSTGDIRHFVLLRMP